MGRVRLDREIVRRGLASSRSEAQDLIGAGRIFVSGSLATKAARLVAASEPIDLRRPERRYVSRGGVKLEAALETFGIDPSGRVCLDVGSSTGGFTDCLLQHGAGRVYAVDVGRAQLHERLRRDPRVISLESTDARRLDSGIVPEPCDLITVDVSFIGVGKVIDHLVGLAGSEGDFIVLVKPQFEAGPADVPRGGVVRDAKVHARVLFEVRERFRRAGLGLAGIRPSPIPGASGNLEYLTWWRRKR